ncbi:MAG: AAA family ATPase, partial [Chloroflexota bacterium]
MKAPLSTGNLRRSYDADNLKLKTTADISGVTKIIGQPRGVQAIEFGIKMKSPGYNIYVLGGSGTGRTTAIQQFVEEQAGNDPVPSDWLYVNNFVEPHKPLAIQLPAGEGCRLRDALGQLIRELRVEIARAFDNEAFRDAALEVRHELEGKREQVFVALQQQATAMGAVVASTAEGFRIVPGKDGQPLQPQELAELTEEQQAAWKKTYHELQHELNEAVHQARKLELEAQDSLEDLKRRVASSVVDVALEELKEAFSSFEKVSSYLEELHQDILDHVDLFREEDEGGDEEGEPGSPMPDEFRRYQVNVLVDHKRSEHAPVIAEYNPAVPNLLGRVEHEARYGGAVVTDFTLIRAGMLHAANGGYLVLRARDLFTEPGAWDALKRALVEAAVRPDDPVTRSGALARSLEPEAIPLDVKVILVGPPGLYYQLHAMDEDFQTIFKVMADFDETVPRTAENELEYAR